MSDDFAARDYEERWKVVLELYSARKFQDALGVALEVRERFPGKFQAEISLGTACIYSRLGEPDNAVHILERAMDDGHWWSKDELLKIPALAPLLDRGDFKAILYKCDALQRAAQARSKPELLVFTPKSASDQPTPLMIAIHGRGDTASAFAKYWKSALSVGVLVAVPGSSQPYGREGYCWDDNQRSRTEVTDAYGQVQASYVTDMNRTIVAGYSQGGELALSLALTAAFPCKGFIAIAPGPFTQPMFEELTQGLESAAQRKLRGYLFTGEKDPTYTMTKRMHEEMIRKHIECNFSAEPGLGHDYPDHFENKLISAVDFVLG